MNPKALKIAIGVHGRFHAFGLASGLLALGHDVHVFTNYPAHIAARFGLPIERIRGFPLHGLAVRILARLGLTQRFPRLDAWMHKVFALWLARKLTAEKWDVSYTWSSVSLEYFKARRMASVRLMARGSTHIREQWQLLHDEEKRCGCPVDKPTESIMQREQREYELADGVMVLSTFSRDSFLRAGIPAEKVHLMVSAVNVSEFAASDVARKARCERLRADQPLRLLMVGTFSYRKGALEAAALARQLPAEQFVFRFVGTIAPEAAALARSLSDKVEWVSRVPQSELKVHYEWGDVFLMPSIEEGLAAVLPQAKAAGLLILATPNSGAEDVVIAGSDGWILPARDADAFARHLRRIQAQRESLGLAMSEVADHPVNRGWTDAAHDFVRVCHQIAEKNNSVLT